MMLKAIEEVRNEKSNARKYAGSLASAVASDMWSNAPAVASAMLSNAPAVASAVVSAMFATDITRNIKKLFSQVLERSPILKSVLESTIKNDHSFGIRKLMNLGISYNTVQQLVCA